MNEDGFRTWLESRYPKDVASTRWSGAKRVETAYGDLDQHQEADGYERLLARMSYTKSEARAGVLNGSGIEINGDPYTGLASLRQALRLYSKFKSV